MAKYDTLLKQTLKGLTERFERANSDLHQAVAQLSQAVQAETAGVAHIVLDKADYQPDSAMIYYLRYVARITKRQHDRRALCIFEVPMKGYPILQYRPESNPAQEPHDTSFLDSSQLEDYFLKLVANEDSELVSLLAYTMMKRTTDSQILQNGHPTDDAGQEEIPF